LFADCFEHAGQSAATCSVLHVPLGSNVQNREAAVLGSLAGATKHIAVLKQGVTNIPQGPTLDRQQSQQFQQQSPQRQRDNAAAALISWSRLRAARPLIHCITNFVSMDVSEF
jgi:hypothetical protein